MELIEDLVATLRAVIKEQDVKLLAGFHNRGLMAIQDTPAMAIARELLERLDGKYSGFSVNGH